MKRSILFAAVIVGVSGCAAIDKNATRAPASTEKEVTVHGEFMLPARTSYGGSAYCRFSSQVELKGTSTPLVQVWRKLPSGALESLRSPLSIEQVEPPKWQLKFVEDGDASKNVSCGERTYIVVQED